MASHGVARSAGPRARTEEARQKELQQITSYKHLVDLVNTKVAQGEYTIEVLALTTKLLAENPEYYTIWNYRRRILQQLITANDAVNRVTVVQDLVTADLHLTFKLLRQFPKCYWIWNHRNWTLQQGESLLPTATARHLWQAELDLVGKMLAADSRNFHAWSYRRFVVAQLQRIPVPTGTSEAVIASPGSMVESEFEYTTKMINTNLSNFSAWHNRSKLIPRLLDERGADDTARKEMFDEELALISSAINTDPFDQSIWYYHQFLMSNLSPTCLGRDAIVPRLTNHDRLKYYEHEVETIREILEDEEDCKWIYEALLHCAACCFEVEGGSAKIFTTMDMRSWLESLRKLDPLRKGRWDDLETALGL